MNMEIAGIHFTVQCQHPLSGERLPETYRQFLKGTITPGGDINVNVRIETGAMPDTTKMTKVFDTGRAWSLFRENDNYFLSLNFHAANGQAIWLAAFDRHCDILSIYCSDLLIEKVDGLTTCFTPLTYPLDQLLLMYILAAKGGALFHAAGVNINGKGFIFPGKSGAGKSTLSRLFSGKDTAEILSDDRIIVRKIDGKFKAFGTPWAGDANIAENKSVMLDRIFFIRHANKNMIKKIKPNEAIKRLIPVTSIPWYDGQAVQSMLAFCEDLVLNIPAYELHFRPDTAMVTFLDDFIVRGKI